MNPIVRFIINMQFIFRPAYWLFNIDYSREWDITLNNLLNQYKFTNIDEHHAQLGPVTIWINNIPYACMHVSASLDKGLYPKYCRVRPSRLTITRCLKRLKLDSRSLEVKAYLRDEILKEILD